MTRNSKTQFRAETTGETIAVHLDEFSEPVKLPVVRIVETITVSELDSFDGIVDLDGSSYYSNVFRTSAVSATWTLPNGKSWIEQSPCTLHKEVHNFLVGGSDVFIYERRQVPASSMGICATPQGSMSGLSEPVFVVRPNLEKKQAEIESLRRLRAEAKKLWDEYTATEIEWQSAYAALESAKAVTGRFYDLPERAVVGEKYAVMELAKTAAQKARSVAGLKFS